MASVYLLQHCYEKDGIEEIKTIGIYSTRKNAEIIIEKYKKLNGFKDYKENFFIDEYVIDKSFWGEGFVEQ